MDDFKNKPFTFQAYSHAYRTSTVHDDITVTFKLAPDEYINASPLVLIKMGTRLKVTVEAIE